jgi:hypothetical protein
VNFFSRVLSFQTEIRISNRKRIREIHIKIPQLKERYIAKEIGGNNHRSKLFRTTQKKMTLYTERGKK